MTRADRPTPHQDPHLWLEELDSARARAWIEARNSQTLAELQDAQFTQDEKTLLDMLNAAGRVPAVHRRAHLIYNFWQDARNPKGLWRRTTLESYRTPAPDWEVVVDVDALARAEGENWVWRGCVSLPPEHRQGLIQLSCDGADAVVIREFDLVAKRFVADGFMLPKAKGSATWFDADTLLVTSVLGGEAFETACGSERTVRKWRRGTPFGESEVVFQGDRSDAAVGGWRTHYSRPARTFFVRCPDLHNQHQFFEDDTGSRRLIDLPSDCGFGIHRDWLIANPQSDWSIGNRTYPAGALIVIDFDAFIAGNREFITLFSPSGRRFLAGYRAGGQVVALKILDNVRCRIELARYEGGRWRLEPVAGLAEMAVLDIRPFESAGYPWPIDEEPDDEEFLVSASNSVTPLTLALVRFGERIQVLKQASGSFNADGLTISQHEAISTDGTPIPYFRVGRTDLPLDGSNAVLMTGYGGAASPSLPHYVAPYGKLWLERGGVFVIANIRGGIELGIEWHQAGLRQGKKLAHDDFAAVAKDLVARGVTRPQRLACDGGSLGGLLVGNMLTRYPDLFGAISCAVPVLDLKRYAKLGGGGHISEFGDPEVPQDWEFMKELSAYHCIEPAGYYPPILLITSTSDDRVHPAHARKMAAELSRQGHRALFYEGTQGGHGIGNSNAQRAFWFALQIAFLRKTIAPEMTEIIMGR